MTDTERRALVAARGSLFAAIATIDDPAGLLHAERAVRIIDTVLAETNNHAGRNRALRMLAS